MKISVFYLAPVVFVAACNANIGSDRIQFQALVAQDLSYHDGDSVISSRGPNSMVSVRPASHGVGSEPIFIVGIQNLSARPFNFLLSDISAVQTIDGQEDTPLKVYTYDEMVSKEQQAQVGRELLASALGGVAAGLGGVDTSGAAIANSQAASAQNLAALDQLYLKDETIAPRGNYAGKLALAAPQISAGGVRDIHNLDQSGSRRTSNSRCAERSVTREPILSASFSRWRVQ